MLFIVKLHLRAAVTDIEILLRNIKGKSVQSSHGPYHEKHCFMSYVNSENPLRVGFHCSHMK